MKTISYFILLLFICMSCQPSDLEQALQLAGENRAELETVLQHYSSNPADSLKYKAAVFLIENMPHYYFYRNDIMEMFQNELYQTASDNECTGEDAIKILERKYGTLNTNEFEIVYDAHVITADYLIRNIEQAFFVWQKQAWGKQITFNDFCEQILPYRTKNEPLDNWREIYYNTYQPILDSLLVNKKDAVAALNLLWDFIVKDNWIFFENIPFPMGPTTLLKHRIGNCANRTEFSTYIMRALGIPGGTDFVLQYPNQMTGGHSWNFVVDTLGKGITYSLYEERPREIVDEIKPKKGRVYRKYFGVQSNNLLALLKNEEDVPYKFKNVFINDVSSEYFPPCEIKVDVPLHSQQGKIMYLATFNNQSWVPITWAKINEKQACFQYVDREIIYLPVYYLGGNIVPVSYPILVNEVGMQSLSIQLLIRWI